jgi:hypothetical protein
MMKIELWMEGYQATGDSSGAQFLGIFEAENLVSAAKIWVDSLPNRNDCFRISDDGIPTYWGCRFSDNEIGARGSFG